jgi:hypothetical protein
MYDCTLAQCVCNWNKSFTGHIQGTVIFPQNRLSRSSVSISSTVVNVAMTQNSKLYSCAEYVTSSSETYGNNNINICAWIKVCTTGTQALWIHSTRTCHHYVPLVPNLKYSVRLPSTQLLTVLHVQHLVYTVNISLFPKFVTLDTSRVRFKYFLGRFFC